jgi:hypothetical protein
VKAGKPRTKPGKYGTLYLYELEYTDGGDRGMGVLHSRVWRYSLEHVQDAFYEGSDGGWVLLSAARVPEEGGMHRAVKHSFRDASRSRRKGKRR